MLDFECVLLLSPLFRLALILRLFAEVTRRRRSPGLPRVCCAVFLFSHAHHALSLSRPQCRIKRRSPRRMTMPSTSPLPWRLFRPQPTTHPSPRALPGRLRRPLSRRVRPAVHTLGEGIVSHWKQPSRFFFFFLADLRPRKSHRAEVRNARRSLANHSRTELPARKSASAGARARLLMSWLMS
jgi:hypothetical protein